MPENFDQVVASYHRSRQAGDLFGTFYTIFLAKSPDIPPKFARTDFARQKLMLKQSLLDMLNFYCDIESAVSEIDRLGKVHRELGIEAQHYELWLDALCEALEKHDPEFTPDLERAWRSAMRKGIERIKTA